MLDTVKFHFAPLELWRTFLDFYSINIMLLWSMYPLYLFEICYSCIFMAFKGKKLPQRSLPRFIAGAKC